MRLSGSRLRRSGSGEVNGQRDERSRVFGTVPQRRRPSYVLLTSILGILTLRLGARARYFSRMLIQSLYARCQPRGHCEVATATRWHSTLIQSYFSAILKLDHLVSRRSSRCYPAARETKRFRLLLPLEPGELKEHQVQRVGTFFNSCLAHDDPKDDAARLRTCNHFQ